ncbi:MAG: cation:proton antiporter, partial [Solirubrobacterales bacterium]
MDSVELILICLFVTVAGLNAAANWLSIPYPILLVLGGLALGLIPGVPDVELDPDLVLVLFLPPLLYSAAFFTDLRSLRDNVRPLSLTAIGLVLLTTVIIAVIAHEVIGMTWAVAFALGAIVSPTDPVAATAIAGRIGVPRRVVTVVEGESLINDATAIT